MIEEGKPFAITPDGVVVHRADCRVILGYAASRNAGREFPDWTAWEEHALSKGAVCTSWPKPENRAWLEARWWTENGFDQAGFDAAVEALPRDRVDTSVTYLTKDEAASRRGGAIRRRCMICAPDLPDPGPYIPRRRSGLGTSREWCA